MIRPHTDWGQFPLQTITGYSETHAGGTEGFPIDIAAGVTVKPYGDPGPVSIWSSASTPPSSIFRLNGVTTGSAPLTRIEDLYFIGAKSGIDIGDADPVTSADYKNFLGVIARCHFGWNQVAINLENKTSMVANLAIRECKIRTNLEILPPGTTPSPVLQDPSVGLRFHSIAKIGGGSPAQVNVEIRNLQTLGNFETMSATGISKPDGDVDFPAGYTDFTRLIEVYTKGSIHNLEHGSRPGFAPIPEVNLDIIGGNLDGKADPNDLNAGWDVGVFATTGFYNDGEHKDFSSGYRIEATGTIFDNFKLAGIHSLSHRWGRGVVTLNGNTIVRRTGIQAGSNPDLRLYNGVHVKTTEAYMGLHAMNANISNNLGNGVYLKTKTTIIDSGHAAPGGSFIQLDDCAISQNGKHGIVHQVEQDGIVGGAWHFVNGNKTLGKTAGFNYSVDYGQGVVDRCAISNNGKAGLFFRSEAFGSGGFINTRFLNCIIWNNPEGGYLADLRGSNSKPHFLAPLGHCTLAGNGDSGAHPYSLQIIEQDRPNLEKASYFWSDASGDLSTKFYNTVLERKSSSADDFDPIMLSGTHPFLVKDSSVPTIFEIGAGGLRYQDGGAFPIFDVSTYTATPFMDSSSWTTLDPTKFYLFDPGSPDDFSVTPTIFPIIGNETVSDHKGAPRPDPILGERDKGADERQ